MYNIISNKDNERITRQVFITKEDGLAYIEQEKKNYISEGGDINSGDKLNPYNWNINLQ